MLSGLVDDYGSFRSLLFSRLSTRSFKLNLVSCSYPYYYSKLEPVWERGQILNLSPGDADTVVLIS